MEGLNCKTHPTYQAKKPPRSGCMACHLMWQITSMQIVNASLRSLAERISFLEPNEWKD